LVYPTSGAGSGWYWDTELSAALAAGVELTPGIGIAAETMTDGFRRWADFMWNVRQSAQNDRLADLIKVVCVAGIGGLGTTRRQVMVAPIGSGYPPMWDPVHGFSHRWGIHYGAARPGGQLHVASYVRAQVRTWLYEAALPFAKLGKLIATDYDAIRVTERDPALMPELGGLGGWKVKELHNMTVPKPRWIESDEKTRTPGVSKPI
jgi:hypothetical protein